MSGRTVAESRRPLLTIIGRDDDGDDELAADDPFAGVLGDASDPPQPETIAELLSRGIPTGLIAPGIDPATLTDESHLVSISGAVSSFAFDAKSGGLKVTFLVPAQHQYLALALRDAARMRLVLRVYALSTAARERYGRSAATQLTPSQERRELVAAQVRERQIRSRVKRIKREWTGPSGPAD